MADNGYYSINEYISDGVQVAYEVSFAGGYISKTHVFVTTVSDAGVVTSVPFTWTGDNQITLTAPVGVGLRLTIQRITPKEGPLVDFTDGAILTEASLDRNARQAVFIAAEAQDVGTLAAARGLLVPQYEKGYTLPSLFSRLNTLFAWSGTGSPIAIAYSTLADFLAPFLTGIKKGDKGDPGSALVVGLFTQISTMTIPVGTDVIHTSGYSQAGIGAAKYSVGPVGTIGSVDRVSGNTLNNRAVRLVEPLITVDMLGAIPDYNAGTGAGTDSYAAFQYGIDYLSNLGGAELWVPGKGAYKLGSPLTPKGKVTLRGSAMGLQGGAGTIYVTGAQFLSINQGGFPNFNIRGCSVVAGNRGVTNFITRQNGVWAYSTIQDNYFVNFRDFDHVGLGLHVFNNNFQNFHQFKIGGADHEFSFNYANYDVDGPSQLTKNDVFWSMEAVSATSFSYNYLTCLKNATDDPIVFEWAASGINQCTNNKFDGGTVCSFRIRSAANQIKVEGNRWTSLATYSGQGYIPLILVQDLADINITGNFVQNIESGAPALSMAGVMTRVSFTDNMVNKDRNDSSTHDLASQVLANGSVVTISGPSIPKTASLPNGGTFYSHQFTRMWTNDSAGGGNPRINYVDLAAVKVGTVIRCFRANAAERWIIYNQATSTAIYDSDANPAKRGFSLVATANGSLTLDI